MGRIWASARRERGFRRDGCASRLARAAAVGGAFALAACAVGPDFIRPASLVEADWTTLRSRAGRPGLFLGAQAYWASFHDETLTRLLKKADAHSPTLLGAAETVTQARRQIRIDVANLLPTVDLSGSSEYGQPTLASSLKGGNLGATTDQLLGQTSWEIDFWGSLRRALASDKNALLSSEAALQASRVSIEASVASAYVNLRMTERRIAVARDNLAKQAENKRIAEAKWREGLDSELDFRQAESQYEQTKAQLPGLQQSLEQYRYSVSELVGETPDWFARTERADAGLPSTPNILPIGAPHDLLRRRPDVLQAEFNAAAQSERIGVAEAALYPTFSLTGAFGYATTGKLVDLFQWNNRELAYGAAFTLPIFDRDKLVSQVEIQDSLFRQQVLAYQNQVLYAQQDVENGLASIVGQTGTVRELQRAYDAAARASQLSLAQYRAGQVDYTTVSSAEQIRATTADSLVQAQGAVLQGYIGTFRAIGGGWEPKPRAAEAGSDET